MSCLDCRMEMISSVLDYRMEMISGVWVGATILCARPLWGNYSAESSTS